MRIVRRELLRRPARKLPKTELLVEAFGVDRVPWGFDARLKRPDRAEAYFEEIIEKCRWLELPFDQRGQAASAWVARLEGRDAARHLREWTSQAWSQEAREGDIDWIIELPPIKAALEANWRGQDRARKKVYLEVAASSGSRHFGNRLSIVSHAMVRAWMDLPCANQEALIVSAYTDAYTQLPEDEEIVSSEMATDSLRAEIATHTYIAWVWYLQSKSPPPLSLIRATACALGLAKWTAAGTPFPARALRRCLGLPSYNRYPAFLKAARLAKDAALSNAEIARELAPTEGQISAQVIAQWRKNMPDFVNTDNDCCMFFPNGIDAVPVGTFTSKEMLDAKCRELTEEVRQWRIQKASPRDKVGGGFTADRRNIVEDSKVEPRVALVCAALYFVQNDCRVRTPFLHALAEIFGLRTAATSRKTSPNLSPPMMRSHGYPEEIQAPQKFRQAIGRDADALLKYLQDTRPNFSSAALNREIDRLLDGGWLVTPCPNRETVWKFAKAVGQRRDTIQRWRETSEYKRRVKDAVLMNAYSKDFWSRRQPR